MTTDNQYTAATSFMKQQNSGPGSYGYPELELERHPQEKLVRAYESRRGSSKGKKEGREQMTSATLLQVVPCKLCLHNCGDTIEILMHALHACYCVVNCVFPH